MHITYMCTCTYRDVCIATAADVNPLTDLVLGGGVAMTFLNFLLLGFGQATADAGRDDADDALEAGEDRRRHECVAALPVCVVVLEAQPEQL